MAIESYGAPTDRPSLEEYIEELETAGRLTDVVEAAAEKAAAIRKDHDAIFYLAGPLTGMPEEVKERYVSLSGLVATFDGPGAKMFGYAPHLHGTDPVKHPDVTPREVRDIDYMFAVTVPDYHINSLDPVAHGNGIEEGWAEAVGIPALYLVPEGKRLSRLVLGMRNIMQTIVYADFETDGLPQVHVVLESIRDGLLS